MALRVTVTDRGASALIRNMTGPALEARVGVQGVEAAAIEHDSGLSVGAVACIREFAPEPNISRGWLSSWVDAHEGEILEAMRAAGERVLTVRGTSREALTELAAEAAAGVKAAIQAAGTPLETGQLLAAITGIVTEQGDSGYLYGGGR